MNIAAQKQLGFKKILFYLTTQDATNILQLLYHSIKISTGWMNQENKSDTLRKVWNFI